MVNPVVDKGTSAPRSVGNEGSGDREKTMPLLDVGGTPMAGVTDEDKKKSGPSLAGPIVDGCAKLDVAVPGMSSRATGLDGNARHVNGILPVMFTSVGTGARSR